MKRLLLFLLVATASFAQNFACPSGTADMMKYFAMSEARRPLYHMAGSANPIYSEVFPNQDFAQSGYWLWLKSASAHGFDVKAFDANFIYDRSTELDWTDNSTFKRFVHDLPISPRCITSGKPGPVIKVADTAFKYYSSCASYKQSSLGTSVNSVDAPVLMATGGNIGSVWTRVLHYRYSCDSNYANCHDEEQFFLGNGFGQWQWKHYHDGVLEKTSTMNNLTPGIASGVLPCTDSYLP